VVAKTCDASHAEAVDESEQQLLVEKLLEWGATPEEVEAASPSNFNPLALDLGMRPPGQTVDLDEFIAGSDLDSDLVRRLWSAFGLPMSGPVRVTPDAAAALQLIAGMASWLKPETALAVARVMGSSASRLAEAMSNAFRVDVELPDIAAGKGAEERMHDNLNSGRYGVPPLLDASNAIFRRHLVLVSYALWSTDEEQSAVTYERSVGFADLVSSTEAVRASSPRVLATMIREFEELVWGEVTSAGGRLVKLIGDEAMFVIEDASAACDVALRLLDASPQRVRVGLAHGTVVGLYGDYYGETVNLAARLVNAAEPSTVVVSDAVRMNASKDFTFDGLPEQELKGFGEPLVFYRAGRH